MKERIALLLLVITSRYADQAVPTVSKPALAVDPLYYGETDEPNFVIRWQYQDFCDHVYDPRKDIWRWPTDEEHGVTFDPRDVRSGDTIFVRKIPQFFEEMHPKIKHPYIIVTAGECLDKMKEWYKKFLDKKKVIAWFGIHPDEMAMNHPKFYPIPIGVHQKPSNYRKRGKLDSYFKRLRTTTEKKYWLYLNFADVGKPERQMLRKRFLKEPYAKRGKRQEFRDYLWQTAESYFVLSPMGLGPDCYRTWEAMLCGSIPVVRRSHLDPMYEGLPVLIVDDWKQITEEYLKEAYTSITSKKYDISRLYVDFWFNKIQEVQNEFLKRRS